MRTTTHFPDDLTTRTNPDASRAATQGMPEVGLDDRQTPDPLLTQDVLMDNLKSALKAAKNRFLWKDFLPEEAVMLGLHQAYDTATDAICGERHDDMEVPPERMTVAGWRGWIYVVAKNKVLSILRLKKTAQLPVDELPITLPVFDHRQRHLALLALSQLPLESQNLIVVVHFHGLSKAKAAKIFELGQGTFDRKLERAIKLLAAVYFRLEREFWE